MVEVQLRPLFVGVCSIFPLPWSLAQSPTSVVGLLLYDIVRMGANGRSIWRECPRLAPSEPILVSPSWAFFFSAVSFFD